MLKIRTILIVLCGLMCLVFSAVQAGGHPAGGDHPKAAKEEPAKEHPSGDSEHPSASVEDQIKVLEEMCSESADARAERQAKKSLLVRMGGEEGVKAFFTDADFLAAGSDVVAGMQAAEYSEDLIQEFMCILMSLKDQVVFE